MNSIFVLRHQATNDEAGTRNIHIFSLFDVERRVARSLANLWLAHRSLWRGDRSVFRLALLFYLKVIILRYGSRKVIISDILTLPVSKGLSLHFLICFCASSDIRNLINARSVFVWHFFIQVILILESMFLFQSDKMKYNKWNPTKLYRLSFNTTVYIIW